MRISEEDSGYPRCGSGHRMGMDGVCLYHPVRTIRTPIRLPVSTMAHPGASVVEGELVFDPVGGRVRHRSYSCNANLRIWRSAFFLRRAPKPLVAPSSGYLKPLESGVTDNHGHAAWASDAQIMERFHGPGNLIGKTKEGSLFFDNPEQGPGHSQVIAGSGSDKTTTAVTRLFHWHGPRVVFDPSRQIEPIMANALREDGYRVISIHPTLFDRKT